MCGEGQKRRWYKRHQHKNDGWGGGGERRAHKTGKWGGEKMYYVRTNTPQPRQEDKLAFAFSFHGPKEKKPSVERIDLPFLAVIFFSGVSAAPHASDEHTRKKVRESISLFILFFLFPPSYLMKTCKRAGSPLKSPDYFSFPFRQQKPLSPLLLPLFPVFSFLFLRTFL